jgi:transcription factor MBP1
VIELLAPIFDYTPGEHTPPPAPKHATAASTKQKQPRQSLQRKLAQTAVTAAQQEPTQYEMAAMQHYMDEHHTPDETSISESLIDDDSMMAPYSSNRKRKRDQQEEDLQSMQDAQHQIWADALLDYFLLADSEDRFPAPPVPPQGLNLDRAIDDKGHSALHWAAAMGDLDIVTDLLNRGARIDNVSHNLETPLMRAVMFTNNFDKNTMNRLIRLLAPTVHKVDWFGSTVFHHVSATTSSKNKYLSARYYIDTIINSLAETWVPDQITQLLNQQDRNGDTAIHIAARHGARKCVRSLLGRNVALDIPNHKGETADEMIQELNARRQRHAGTSGRQASSSPFGPDRAPLNGSVNNGDSASMAGGPATGTTAVMSLLPGSSQQTLTFQSATASTLASKITPSFATKLRALASAYEADYSEKAQEAAENEILIRKRAAEVEALKRQCGEQARQLDEVVSGELRSRGIDGLDAERAKEEEELAGLEREAISLLELEQRDTLVRTNISPKDLALTNGGVGSVDDQRLAMAAKLRATQEERRRLTSDIVRSLSHAGLGEKQTEYKRLIHGALGVREDEMESMLDEMLGQLEDDRREIAVMEEVA